MKKALIVFCGMALTASILAACSSEVRQDVLVTQNANPQNGSNSTSGLGIGLGIAPVN